MSTRPVDVVTAQVAAYNARDLKRFMSYYAPDAVIYDAVVKCGWRARVGRHIRKW